MNTHITVSLPNNFPIIKLKSLAEQENCHLRYGQSGLIIMPKPANDSKNTLPAA